MKTLRFTLLFLLLPLFLAGCRPAASDESTVLPDTTGGAEKIYEMGETAEYRGLAMTLTGAETVAADNALMKPDEGNVFVVCVIEVVNNSDAELVINPLLNLWAYVDGEPVDPSLEAVSAQSRPPLAATVPPGASLTGVLGYEVPAGWQLISLNYEPNLLGDAVLRFDVKRITD